MQASDHTNLNISCHCPLAPAGLTSFSTTSGFSPTYSMTPWNMSKSEKTIKKRKIRSLRPMFFFFLHSLSKNTLILSSRPEVLWTGVEGSAFLKAIPVADVSTSLDMTLGGRFADMNINNQNIQILSYGK